MPADEARTFLQQLQEKIASSEIEVTHRDVLIRLRSIIEEDLEGEDSAEGSVTLGSRRPKPSQRSRDIAVHREMDAPG